jgi:hypothetical protein
MGVLFRPRRPLLRLATGAATAGIAYNAGKSRAQQDVYKEEAAAAYEATQPAPRAPAGGPVLQAIRRQRSSSGWRGSTSPAS